MTWENGDPDQGQTRIRDDAGAGQNECGVEPVQNTGASANFCQCLIRIPKPSHTVYAVDSGKDRRRSERRVELLRAQNKM